MAFQSPGAGNRVANIPELLEQILLEMDPHFTNNNRKTMVRTLLRMQQVNHAFRSTILESTKLKKMMFMVAPVDDYRPYTCYDNPILEVCDLHVEDEDSWMRITWPIDGDPKDGIARITVSVTLLPFTQDVRALRRSLWKFSTRPPIEPSWRRMYLNQGQYKVEWSFDTRFGPKFAVEMMNPTVGEICEAMWRYCKDHER